MRRGAKAYKSSNQDDWKTVARWYASQLLDLRDVISFDASAMLCYPEKVLEHTKTPIVLVVKLHLIILFTKHHAS